MELGPTPAPQLLRTRTYKYRTKSAISDSPPDLSIFQKAHIDQTQINMSSTTTAIPEQIAITATLVESTPDPTQKYVDKYSVTIGPDCLDKDQAIKALFPDADPTTHRLVYDDEFHSIGPEGSNQKRSFNPSRGPGTEPFDPDVIGMQKVPGEIGEIYTLGSEPVSPFLSPVGTPLREEKVITTTTTTTVENRVIDGSPPISEIHTPPITPPDTPPLQSPSLVTTSGVDSPPVMSPTILSPPIVSPPLVSPVYSTPAITSVRDTSVNQSGAVLPPSPQEVQTSYFTR
jgi:hypothetical protein